jgi:hypothetical protein
MSKKKTLVKVLCGASFLFVYTVFICAVMDDDYEDISSTCPNCGINEYRNPSYYETNNRHDSSSANCTYKRVYCNAICPPKPQRKQDRRTGAWQPKSRPIGNQTPKSLPRNNRVGPNATVGV